MARLGSYDAGRRQTEADSSPAVPFATRRRAGAFGNIEQELTEPRGAIIRRGAPESGDEALSSDLSDHPWNVRARWRASASAMEF
jgi:hypothetical protein